MKKPKKLRICGVEYKITYESNDKGSCSNVSKQLINIGAKPRTREWEHVVHEVAEVIFNERDLVYDGVNRPLLYIMNHGDFTIFADDLANALRPFIKIKNARKRRI